MIEIYNEKVRDLLNTSKAPEKGLQVREDAKRGLFYGNFVHFVKKTTHLPVLFACECPVATEELLILHESDGGELSKV